MSSQKMLPRLRYESDGAIATLILARPEADNALDGAMVDEIAQAFLSLDQDPAIRVIVLKGEGSVFCAGTDLDWLRKLSQESEAENVADTRRFAAMLDAIAQCGKPVVAVLQGPCHGIGIGLVAAADIAVSSSMVHFAFGEARLGLVPGAAMPYVVRAIGERAARRYFLTGERFGAMEARRLGLLHDVFSENRLSESTAQIIKALVEGAPNAQKSVKQLLLGLGECRSSAEMIDDIAHSQARARLSGECREGLAAFAAKRPAQWEKP